MPFASLSISVNEDQAAAIDRELADFPALAQLAGVRAVNSTVVQMRAKLAKTLAKASRADVGIFLRRIEIYRATQSNPAAHLVVKDRRINLASFGAFQTPHGVVVPPLPGIKVLEFPHAFRVSSVANASSGRSVGVGLVLERAKSNDYGARKNGRYQTKAVRAGQDDARVPRYPLVAMKGPSPSRMVQNIAGLIDQVGTDMAAALDQNINRAIDRILARRSSPSEAATARDVEAALPDDTAEAFDQGAFQESSPASSGRGPAAPVTPRPKRPMVLGGKAPLRHRTAGWMAGGNYRRSA